MGGDLAQIYARVVAVRPDLVVDRLRFEPSVMWGSWYRCAFPFRPDYESFYGSQFRWLHGDEASALITVKWEDGLDDGWFVLRSAGSFAVVQDVGHAALWFVTRIEALEKHHIAHAPGSTKGPNDER